MAAILIFPSSISLRDGDVLITGDARVEPGSESIPWGVAVAWSTLSAVQVNSAIKTAAVDAAAAAGYTVGVLDKKIMLAGAVGL